MNTVIGFCRYSAQCHLTTCSANELPVHCHSECQMRLFNDITETHTFEAICDFIKCIILCVIGQNFSFTPDIFLYLPSDDTYTKQGRKLLEISRRGGTLVYEEHRIL